MADNDESDYNPETDPDRDIFFTPPEEDETALQIKGPHFGDLADKFVALVEDTDHGQVMLAEDVTLDMEVKTKIGWLPVRDPALLRELAGEEADLVISLGHPSGGAVIIDKLLAVVARAVITVDCLHPLEDRIQEHARTLGAGAVLIEKCSKCDSSILERRL